MTTRTEYGVRLPDGTVSAVSERSAAEGYMTARQYANRRAIATGGAVVFSVETVTRTPWAPVPATVPPPSDATPAPTAPASDGGPGAAVVYARGGVLIPPDAVEPDWLGALRRQEAYRLRHVTPGRES